MTGNIRIALAQINPTVGDFKGNTSMIAKTAAAARKMGADIAIFPELAVTGYPPEDLLLRPAFIRRCSDAVAQLAKMTDGIVVVAGAPVKENRIYNAAAVLAGGKVAGVIMKNELPNYGVFDERRYFSSGDNGPLIKIGDALIGVSICEDIWVENDILRSQVADGANLLLNLSSSPYRLGAGGERHTLVAGHAKKLNTPLAYCNLVGGQDELVFDGGSFVTDANGEVTASAEYFREDILIADIILKKHPAARHPTAVGRDIIELAPSLKEKPETPAVNRRKALSEDEEVYEALTLGVRDYACKNGFDTAVIALSGGVDSALTTAIAVDALGPERVKTVYMPSPYSSPESKSDAKRLTDGLQSGGVEMMTLPIGGAMNEYDKALAGVFKGGEPGLAEENIQARIRGAMLMALSNKFGWLVLTTGNKSEIAVGYCTLYGDTVGGFAVLKDLFKTRVYRLCRWRNAKAGIDIIPQSIIEKPPSAELRPGQLDTDSLPPYDLLDPILAEYIEHDKNIDEIRKLGYGRRLVIDVIRMVDASEYKRRQGPLGVKITPKAFGRDRRTPVTCRFTDQ